MTRLWTRLSKRERALVIATCVVLLAVLGKYAVINPLVERREWVKTQLEIQPRLLEKNLRYISRKEEFAAALQAARDEIKAREPRLLTGGTPSVSASDLQETVQALAAKDGIQVITTRVLNPETVGSFSKISIQMEIGGQIEQIANLIRDIESSPKLIAIEELNVRSLFRPAGVPQPQVAAPLAVQNLRVSLTVSGFARSQPVASAQPELPGRQTHVEPDGTRG